MITVAALIFILGIMFLLAASRHPIPLVPVIIGVVLLGVSGCAALLEVVL